MNKLIKPLMGGAIVAAASSYVPLPRIATAVGVAFAALMAGQGEVAAGAAGVAGHLAFEMFGPGAPAPAPAPEVKP